MEVVKCECGALNIEDPNPRCSIPSAHMTDADREELSTEEREELARVAAPMLMERLLADPKLIAESDYKDAGKLIAAAGLGGALTGGGTKRTRGNKQHGKVNGR